MDRRTFVKSTAVLGAATLSGNLAHAQGNKAEGTPAVTDAGLDKPCAEFSFRKGKFKILQLTDTHYISGDPRSERALKNVEYVLDKEKPDLVIHTGDIIFGQPAEQSLRDILAPISERKIPFAVALGNHDGQFGLTRTQVFDVIKSIPGNINRGVPGITGDSNDIITLSSESGESKWVFYLFDSLDKIELGDLKGYDYIHFDQIDWYLRHSREYTRGNGGKPLPSLAFFHIPFPEFKTAWQDKWLDVNGFIRELPGSPIYNSGLFLQMMQAGDIKAVICGHDHNSDYVQRWHGMLFMYGRFSGGDTVYNDLKPNGARIIELSEGSEEIHSWIRLYKEGVLHDAVYPGFFD